MAGRRFIAGAVCPQCGGFDTVYLESNELEHLCCCTRCDFMDRRSRQNETDTEVKAVRIIDPRNAGKAKGA